MGSDPSRRRDGLRATRRVGRHRARNGAVGTALAALLVTGTQLVAQPSGTLAHFSDQQGVGFEITGTAPIPSSSQLEPALGVPRPPTLGCNGVG